MKPVAILSTDTTPDYLFCLPIVARSWQLQGFDPWCNIWGEISSDLGTLMVDKCPPGLRFYEREKHYAYNDALEVQCSRLYEAHDAGENVYCIVTDADMFIGSSFLCRDFDKVNVFGHDLTGRNHIPICYVGMIKDKWIELMGENMDADIADHCDLSTKEKAWVCDQDILTAKLKAYGYDKINFIDRGIDPKNHNLPRGRWDRYGGFKKPQGEIHDCHLPRKPYTDENFKKIVDMCETLYPYENWNWLIKYRREFLKHGL